MKSQSKQRSKYSFSEKSKKKKFEPKKGFGNPSSSGLNHMIMQLLNIVINEFW
jgi:hypothetical protein